jgi:hypothetical protein
MESTNVCVMRAANRAPASTRGPKKDRSATCKLKSTPARVFAWTPGIIPLRVPSNTPIRVPSRISIIHKRCGRMDINSPKCIPSYDFEVMNP